MGADASVSSTEHFKYTGAPPSTVDCQNFAADAYGDWQPIVVYLDSTSALIGTRVTDLSNPAGGDAFHLASTSGTSGGGSLGAGTATLVNFTVARRYRGGKPRIYLPTGTDSDVSTRQHWSGTFATAVQGQVHSSNTTFGARTRGSTTLTGQCSVSYYSGFTVQTNPGTGRARNVPKLRATPLVDTILGTAVPTTIASQRRRNRF